MKESADIKQRIVLEDGVTPALDAMTKAITGASAALDKLLESASAIGAINTANSRDSLYQLELELREVSSAFNRARQDAQQMVDAANGLDMSRLNASAAASISVPHQSAIAQNVEAANTNRMQNAPQTRATNENTSAITKLVGAAQKVAGVVMLVIGAIGSLQQAIEWADSRSNERAQLGMLSEEARNGLSADQIRSFAEKYANRIGMSSGDFMSQSLQLLNSTGGAFGSIGEAMNYNELMQKQMKLAGVSGQAADSVSLQWRQGLTKGFASQEINSVLENAPVLAERLAKTMGISLADLKDAAAAGQVTADVAKRALFENADDIESRFAEMPRTWEMIGAQLENGFMSALDPVLQAVSDIASSGVIEDAVTMIQNGFSVAYDLAKWIYSTLEENIFPAFEALGDNVRSLIGEGSSGASLFIKLLANIKLVIENITAMIGGWQKMLVAMVSGFDALVYNISIAFSNLATRIKGFFGFGNGDEMLEYNFNAFGKAFDTAIDGVEQSANGALKLAKDLFTDSDDYNSAVKAITEAFDRLSSETDRNARIGATPTRPLYTKQVGDTKIDKASLQYLKEMAQAEIINRVNNIQPSISATFGDVHQTADVDGMIERLEADFNSARGQNLMLKTGMAFVG